MALLIALLPVLAVQVDRQARDREVKFVSAGISQAMANLVNRTGSAANWDEALENTDRFNPAWAQSELTSATDGDQFNRVVMLLDHANAVLFQRDQARPMPDDRATAFVRAAGGLVQRLRWRERSRPMRGAVPVPQTSSSWLTEAATLQVLGRTYFVVAALLGTDVGRAGLTHDRAPILLLASDLANSILPKIGPAAMLEGASLTGPETSPAMASLGLADEEGRVVARFAWMPSQPGAALLRDARVPFALAVLAMLATVLIASRNSARAVNLLRASERQAQHLALHDSLTGLGNRRALMNRLDRALAQPAPTLGVLLIDLDRFRHVNERFGQRSGDELICATGQRLTGLLRHGDGCFRLGSNEFVILSSVISYVGAKALAGRVLQSLAKPLAIPGATLHGSCSIGISLGQPGDTAADLLHRANLALYHAKNAGRGTFRFHDPAMDHAVSFQKQTEADLRDALAAAAIEVAYQPQMRGGRLVGVEALARWAHPERGPIAPAVFIPLAEECGLIHQLGLAVMRQAFADSGRWPGICVALNVSARQLRLPDFLPDLRALVSVMAVDPRNFELELTESLLLGDDPQMLATLTEIRALGFGLAIDDFGTGFSSLSYLTRFPITRIKIDRSFISRLPEDAQASAIVTAIIRLAEGLGLEVIAEGVETPEQHRRLIELGCTTVQGYLTGRPVQADLIGHPELQLAE